MLREIPTLHTFPPRSQPHSDEDQVGFETKAVSEGSRHQSGCDHREHSLIACKMKGFLSLQELVLLFMVKSTKSGQFVFFEHTKGTSRQPLLISKLVSTSHFQPYKVRSLVRLLWLVSSHDTQRLQREGLGWSAPVVLR